MVGKSSFTFRRGPRPLLPASIQRRGTRENQGRKNTDLSLEHTVLPPSFVYLVISEHSSVLQMILNFASFLY